MSPPAKTVVVTGAKGGTGPSLVNGFRAAGYRVIGADLKPCGPMEDDYRQVDLQDGADVHDLLAGADAVVHFGSLPSDSATSWETAYRNIALGGYHILQAAANLRIRRVVLASSATIYGDYRGMPYFPIDEDMPHAPIGIYGAAKEHIETLARHYCRWHGVAIAAIRPQRIVYEGAYSWRAKPYNGDDAAAPDVLWSYLDARDLAEACRGWIESDLGGFEAFNVAADDVCVETPTRELLRKYYPHVTDLRDELAGHAGLVSCRKIKRMLGWRPRWNWRDIRAESETAAKLPRPASS